MNSGSVGDSGSSPDTRAHLKLLIATLLQPTSRSGAAERLAGVEAGLSAYGAKVEVVSASGLDLSGKVSQLVRWGRLLRSARRMRQDVLSALTSDKPDCVYIRRFPADYWVIARRLRALHIPYVVEVHSVGSAEYRAEAKGLRGRIYAALEVPTIRGCAGVVAVTEELRQAALEAAGVAIPSIVIGSGVDTSIVSSETREDVRRRLGVDQDARVMVMAGFEAPWHGADRALGILAALPWPDSELWLVGSTYSPRTVRITAEADSLGLRSRVRLFAWMGDQETADLVGAADVGLGPLAMDRKGLQEATPLKTRLYLSLGIPVLINYRDSEINGDEAFVASVDSNEPAALAAAVQPLLKREGRLGEKARSYAENRLDWKAVGRRTGGFIEEVVRVASHVNVPSVGEGGRTARIRAYAALARRSLTMLIGRSYWHVDQGIGRAFTPEALMGYFNDLTGKAAWPGPVDLEGLPLTSFGGDPVAFPTTRLQKALGHWDRALLSEGDTASELMEFMRIAEWTESAQDVTGGWPVWPFIGLAAANPYSAMTQGQAMSVLLRAAQHSGESRFLEAARRGSSLLLTPIADGGVCRPGRVGLILEELPVKPPSTVLNGWVFAIFGLYDLCLVETSSRLEEAIAGSVAELAARLPRFDAGYWSRYVEDGAIASPFYQRLHVAQMEALELAFPEQAHSFSMFRGRLLKQLASRRWRARAVAVKVVEKLRNPPSDVAR